MQQALKPRQNALALALVLWLALATACSSTVHPPGAAKDGQHKVVSSLVLVGAKSINKRELLDGLAMRGPRRNYVVGRTRTYFDPLTHRLDVDRIEAYYAEQGFLSAKVVKAEVIKKGSKNRKLIYTIEEGERTKITKIEVKLSPGSNLDADALAQLSVVKVGDAFRLEVYEEASTELLRGLLKAGYAFAEVTGRVEVQIDKTKAELLFKVDPGPLARFGPITIVGNFRIPSDEVRARLRFREGEPFSWEKLELTRTAIYGMGVFASVEFDHKRQGDDPITPLVLRVKESSRYELKLGVGAGIDRINYEARAKGRFRVASFIVPLGKLRLEATPRLSYLRGLDDRVAPAFEALAAYDVQSIFQTPYDFSSKFSYILDNFTGYSIQGPRVSVGLSRGFLRRRLQLSVAWRFRYQYLFDVDKALSDEDQAAVGLVEPYRLGTLIQRLSYDKRDSVQAPTRGWYFSFEVEEARDFLGSDFEYVRASPEIRGYYALFDSTILAAKFRIASTLLIGDLLPITQRYFSGGSSVQRGFDSRALSPVLGSGGGVPVGGEALIETSMEIRQGVGDTPAGLFGLVLFMDGAEVTNRYENLFDEGLHWASGAGVRLQTIVGTLGIDFGYRLNRRGAGEPAPNDNYSVSAKLGEAF